MNELPNPGEGYFLITQSNFKEHAPKLATDERLLNGRWFGCDIDGKFNERQIYRRKINGNPAVLSPMQIQFVQLANATACCVAEMPDTSSARALAKAELNRSRPFIEVGSLESNPNGMAQTINETVVCYKKRLELCVITLSVISKLSDERIAAELAAKTLKEVE